MLTPGGESFPSKKLPSLAALRTMSLAFFVKSSSNFNGGVLCVARNSLCCSRTLSAKFPLTKNNRTDVKIRTRRNIIQHTLSPVQIKFHFSFKSKLEIINLRYSLSIYHTSKVIVLNECKLLFQSSSINLKRNILCTPSASLTNFIKKTNISFQQISSRKQTSHFIYFIKKKIKW